MTTPRIDPFVNFVDRFGRSGSLIPNACLWIDQLVLGANTAANYTPPSNARLLLFSYAMGEDVFVSTTGAAIIPAANIANGTGVDINPGGMLLTGNETVSFISANATKVAIRAYGG